MFEIRDLSISTTSIAGKPAAWRAGDDDEQCSGCTRTVPPDDEPCGGCTRTVTGDEDEPCGGCTRTVTGDEDEPCGGCTRTITGDEDPADSYKAAGLPAHLAELNRLLEQPAG